MGEGKDGVIATFCMLKTPSRSPVSASLSLSHMPTAYDSHADDDHIPVPSESGTALDQLVAVLQAAGVAVRHQKIVSVRPYSSSQMIAQVLQT